MSHPADSIVSLIGKPANCAEGPGLSTRVLMIGTLTGFQWWIYDSFNTLGHRWQLNVVIGVGSADVRVRELVGRKGGGCCRCRYEFAFCHMINTSFLDRHTVTYLIISSCGVCARRIG